MTSETSRFWFVPDSGLFFLCGSKVGPGSRGTVFLPVTVSLSLVGLLFLVFSSLFGGLNSLFDLVVLTLVLILTLEGRAAFWLGFFRLIARISSHF